MRKSLNLKTKRGRPAMAGLLLIALGCTPLLGCLFPQDEQVINELPPKRNSPLRIKERQWHPNQRTTFLNSTFCRNEQFDLLVIDADLADVVTSRWFIDKTDDDVSTAFEPSPIRSGTAERIVTAPTISGFTGALANLAPGVHTLTVYVTDSTFEQLTETGVVTVSRPSRLLPDGTPAPDEGSFDRFTWILDVEPCN